MTGLRSRSLAALVLIVSLAACKKEGSGDSPGLPPEMQPHPAKGDPSKIAIPRLMAHVPADTPYLVAGLDAIPPEVYEHVKLVLAPLAGLAGAALVKESDDNQMLKAILDELKGKGSAAGVESLGFSTEPRFAIYGLGLQPVVARLAIKDAKALLATIERVAAKGGKDLPAMASKDGRNYWLHTKDDLSVVIALADSQLIFAVGKAADVDARLGLILGIDKPARNMADGALVKQLMARHGFGGQLIAFGDTRAIAGKAMEAAGVPANQACSAELDRLSATAPRLVYGYGEMSASKLSGGLVLELSSEAVGDVRAIKVEIPGLAPALSGHPLFALAGGVDLPKAQQLAIAIAHGFTRLGDACGLGALADGAERAARNLGKPLPELLAQITGGAVVLDELAFPANQPGQMPERVEGVVLLASRDARAVFEKAAAMEPQIKSFGIASDGKLHGVNIPLPLPFSVSIGVGERAIVATAGDKSRASGEKLLAASGGGKAPLLAVAYDVGRFLDLVMQSFEMKRAAAADPAKFEAFDKVKGLFGRTAGAVDVTDNGVAFWSTIDFK